jgi:hypothetical protein
MTDRARLRRLCFAVLLLLAPLWPSSAAAMTGNDWRALPISARTSYVTGVVDNFTDVATAIKTLVPAEKRTASEKMLVAFQDCMARTARPPRQLTAVVDKYLRDNPARRHTRMSGLVFEALSCKDAAPSPAVRKGE